MRAHLDIAYLRLNRIDEITRHLFSFAVSSPIVGGHHTTAIRSKHIHWLEEQQQASGQYHRSPNLNLLFVTCATNDNLFFLIYDQVINSTKRTCWKSHSFFYQDYSNIFLLLMILSKNNRCWEAIVSHCFLMRISSLDRKSRKIKLFLTDHWLLRAQY